jgi:hypothetical protein
LRNSSTAAGGKSGWARNVESLKRIPPDQRAVPSWIITSPRVEPTAALYKQRDRRERGAGWHAIEWPWLRALATLKEWEARRVSVVCIERNDVRSDYPHGRMMATMLAGLTEFEHGLIRERIRSGIGAVNGLMTAILPAMLPTRTVAAILASAAGPMPPIGQSPRVEAA